MARKFDHRVALLDCANLLGAVGLEFGNTELPRNQNWQVNLTKTLVNFISGAVISKIPKRPNRCRLETTANRCIRQDDDQFMQCLPNISALRPRRYRRLSCGSNAL